MKRHERRVRAVASRWLGHAAYGRPLPVVLARLAHLRSGMAWARVIVGARPTLDDLRLSQCCRWVEDIITRRRRDWSDALKRRMAARRVQAHIDGRAA